MLDKATASVLSIVNDQCKEDIYVILKNEDITPQLSKKINLAMKASKALLIIWPSENILNLNIHKKEHIA